MKLLDLILRLVSALKFWGPRKAQKKDGKLPKETIYPMW